MSGVLRNPATAAPVSSASSFLPSSSANSSTSSQAPPGGPSSMTGHTAVTGSIRTMGATGGVPAAMGRSVVEDTKRSPFVTQPSMEQRSAGKKRPLSPSASSSNNRPTDTSATAAPISASASASAPPERPQHLSEKKLRRLEKNRLSARECRRRKREAAQDLEREINVLEGENLRLRLQLQIGEEAEETSQQEQQRVTEEMDALLKSGAAESEVYARIEEFKEKFADYGRDRRSAIEFHLRNVERLLMPTTTTSVAMRALQGDALNATVSSSSTSSGSASSSLPVPATDSVSIGCASTDPTLQSDENTSQQQSGTSANSSGASSGAASASVGVAGSDGAQTPSVPLESKKMFQYLVQYLKVTPEQAGALKDSRHVAKDMDAALMKSLDMLQELQGRLTQCGEDLEAEFNTVRMILTPTQAAKFLVWVANNGACMHMLNELWSKVYPKPCESLEEDDTAGAGEDGESKFPAK
mmetsp:Transcript_15459/g.28068  ORF Transcript_15459/g.28068 Transcript_15459/m.28068 type:complete len:471 (-) Transcript_15459:153-1565(-)|eukprot:CAMPEP_0198280122 /NCGR_PEP_ID=MMETSP1449-20131203/273_1 /TAXON_ID=420275 /ORGANISM="Attheya septentrionalis, Strain CCMP2084" /LENGTH=470 /DNA_ID=CAMNT_0043975401 /DNA_START=86 /DNA_END=1498 /DNA_ORIENTATION=-